MTRIISLHSFTEGAGKTTLAANIAALMAHRGRQVALLCVRTDDPTLRHIFTLRQDVPSLNDYIQGSVPIGEIAQDVTAQIGLARGRLHVVELGVPSGAPPSLNVLSSALDALSELLHLDVVLIENPAGLSRSALTLIALAHLLTVVLLLDQKDYNGVSVLLDVAERLDVPLVRLIVNQVSSEFTQAEVKLRVEQTYQQPVAVVVPHSPDLNGRNGLIVVQNSSHVFSAACSVAASALLEVDI